jgi:hypothetical protein
MATYRLYPVGITPHTKLRLIVIWAAGWHPRCSVAPARVPPDRLLAATGRLAPARVPWGSARTSPGFCRRATRRSVGWPQRGLIRLGYLGDPVIARAGMPTARSSCWPGFVHRQICARRFSPKRSRPRLPSIPCRRARGGACDGRPAALHPNPGDLGIELTGELPQWCSAKDVILEMLRRHRIR